MLKRETYHEHTIVLYMFTRCPKNRIQLNHLHVKAEEEKKIEQTQFIICVPNKERQNSVEISSLLTLPIT